MTQSDIPAVIRRLDKASTLHRAAIYKASVQNGLHPGQLPIIDYVMQNEGCSQKQLAAAMRVSAASVATSVRRMQSAGLLEKITDSDDKRLNRLYTTPAGRDSCLACTQAYRAMDEELLSIFTPEEKARFGDLLTRLVDKLSAGMVAEDDVEEMFMTLRQNPPPKRK